MPSPADDSLRMLQAGGYVAAVAVPLAVVCGSVARWRLGTLCPRWRHAPFVWPGLAILGFFLAKELLPIFIPALDKLGVYQFIYPNGFPSQPNLTEAEADTIVRNIKAWWLSLVWVPLILIAAVALRSGLFASPPDWQAEFRQTPRTVSLGLLGWATFGVLAYLVNAGLTFLFDAISWPIAEHPLSKMGASGDGVGGVLLVLAACVSAPLLEEFLYRGLLVPWAGGRWFRPWCLMFAAGVLALMAPQQFLGQSLGFVALLAVGLYLIQRFGKRSPKFPQRTVLAVWSSAALFATAHSSVWPTPIPLFVLGLGLGYLTARTRSWAASAIAHAAFNAVSTVWVFLRG